MKTLIVCVIIFGLLSAGCGTNPYVSITDSDEQQIENKVVVFQKEEAIGAQLKIVLNDGKEFSGELLSVRDSTILVCTKYSATENELESLQYPIHSIRTDKIWEITLEGSNYRWIGLGIGVAAGIGVGILVGVNYESEEVDAKYESCVGCFMGTLVGSLVVALGAGVGLLASTDDVIFYEIPPGYKFLPLKSLSRYPDEEPEYLKAIK